MIVFDRSALVEHSAQDMYALVNDVESYPGFLPWCNGAELRRQGAHEIATIHINFHGIRQQFTTQNTNEPGSFIGMQLLAGPFRRLQGQWRFVALSDAACKVEFHLEYEIASKVLERMIGPVFHHIANSLVDAFSAHADRLYGRK